MNRTQLIKNLRWLGKSNELMDLLDTNDSDDGMGSKDDDNKVPNEVSGRGISRKKKSTAQHWKSDVYFDDGALCKALPEMSSTLSSWMLHGQNLGGMLRNYRQQYSDLCANQQQEFWHFFNTASTVLDTIGSMTENAILCSMKFDKDELSLSSCNDLIGGSIENKPPVKLPPTDTNLSHYFAVFLDYQLDNGHMLQPNPSFGAAIFSSDYPPYPDVIRLRVDSTLPTVNKEYSTDNNSSTDDSMEFSSDESEEDEQTHDSDESYM